MSILWIPFLFVLVGGLIFGLAALKSKAGRIGEMMIFAGLLAVAVTYSGYPTWRAGAMTLLSWTPALMAGIGGVIFGVADPALKPKASRLGELMLLAGLLAVALAYAVYSPLSPLRR